MPKKGERSGPASKPKPRVLVYAGAAGTGALALGAQGTAGKTGVPFDVPANIKAKSGFAAISGNVAAITTNPAVAARVAIPAVLGAAASWAADKLGINRMMARARMPWRW